MITRLTLVLLVTLSAPSVPDLKLALEADDVRDIAVLLKLEDVRQYDEAALARLLESRHPEVRRLTVRAIGRIADPRGRALVAPLRGDAMPDVVAEVAFAAGQLKDPDAVGWLGEQLSARPQTAIRRGPPIVSVEAARALGKIRTPEARATLARFLTETPLSTQASVVGEALLSIGRFTTRGDPIPIVRWATSRDVEIRWRAAWALFRPRDPAEIARLSHMASDSSGDVRFWAVRGLALPTPPQAARGAQQPPQPADQVSADDRALFAAQLRALVRDGDRRVRTEALRALAGYDDDASFGVILAALDSSDTWLSVSAAEALARYPARAGAVVPKLIAAAAPARPRALRITALTPLVTLAPERALDVATSLIHDSSVVARTAAAQALQRLGEPGRARLAELAADPASKTLIPAAAGPRPPRTAPTARPDAEYQSLAERWIVGDYNAAPKPRAILETPKGSIEIELYPSDAPFGVDYFLNVVESKEIVGTEFGRVVPDFVVQQRAIRNEGTLRDEVNRHGLTRGNLSWASAGLDTGRPGYTLGNTPQPHNEGDFTALGRVVSGMEVVDRLELGDAITGARVKRR